MVALLLEETSGQPLNGFVSMSTMLEDSMVLLKVTFSNEVVKSHPSNPHIWWLININYKIKSRLQHFIIPMPLSGSRLGGIRGSGQIYIIISLL